MKNRIKANFTFYGQPGFPFKLLQKHPFIVFVEGIYDFIGKTNKSINGVNGSLKFWRQHSNAKGKGGAVAPGNVSAAFLND
jgi:hypothetical protein